MIKGLFFQEKYVPFKLVKVDTRGASPVYQYLDEKIIDRESKGRYALGLIYHGVNVKLDRYQQLAIPEVVYKNKDFMMNFTSRMNDSFFLANEIYPHPDSVYITQ